MLRSQIWLPILLLLAMTASGSAQEPTELSTADRLERIAGDFYALGMDAEAVKYRGRATETRASQNRQDLMAKGVEICTRLTLQMKTVQANIESPAVDAGFKELLDVDREWRQFLSLFGPTEDDLKLQTPDGETETELGGQTIQNLQRFPEGFKRL